MPKNLHVCTCGCWKFYCGYATVKCALCGKIQPGKMVTDYYLDNPVVWFDSLKVKPSKPPVFAGEGI